MDNLAVKKCPVPCDMGQVAGPINPGGMLHENVCALTLEGNDTLLYCYANTLRKTLIGEIPYIGFCPTSPSDTTIDKNTTMFSQEFIRLRISMLPLSLRPNTIECADGVFRWINGKVPVYKAHVSGQEGRHMTLTGKDIVGPGDGEDPFLKPDPITGDYAMIAKMRMGQELSVECRPRVDIGRNHAAFSPIGGIRYDIVGGTKIRMVVEANNRSSPTAEQHVYDALYWAAERMRAMHEKLPKAVEQAVCNQDMVPPALDIRIEDENDTRGALLVNEIRYAFMNNDDEQSKNKVAFASWKVPHPLRKEIVVRIQPLQDQFGASPITAAATKKWAAVIVNACAENSIARIENLKRSWGAIHNIKCPTIANVRNSSSSPTHTAATKEAVY